MAFLTSYVNRELDLYEDRQTEDIPEAIKFLKSHVEEDGMGSHICITLFDLSRANGNQTFAVLKMDDYFKVGRLEVVDNELDEQSAGKLYPYAYYDGEPDAVILASWPITEDED